MPEYSLRPFQQKAVEDVLSSIASAQQLFETSGGAKRSAVILSAPTGAGKTVMAGTVIDTLFTASEIGGPDTVILWVTDDPALNRQSSERISDVSSGRVASEILSGSGSDFDQELFTPGILYMLNVQAASTDVGMTTKSDFRKTTIWETIENTSRVYGSNFIVMIDEAHRGTRGAKQDAEAEFKKAHVNVDEDYDDDTIVGEVTKHAPVVIGISATEARFANRMNQKQRKIFPVKVSLTDVSQEGMIKSRLMLKKPSEKDAHITMLRQAVQSTIEFEGRWRRHYETTGGKLVLPVLVVQVRDSSPKKSNDEDALHRDIAEFVKVILDEWKGLVPKSIVNVFGEHKSIKLGSHHGKELDIAYMRPDEISGAVVGNDNYKGTHDVRVVIAKNAITTGWDCPRAEVLISFRSAQDKAYIKQLLGRMVRNPLAEIIPSDDFLNTAYCTLPYFNSDELKDFTKSLEKDCILGVSELAPITYERSPTTDPRVFETFVSIPSYHIPRHSSSDYITDVRKLSVNLMLDGIVKDATRQTDLMLCRRLDRLISKSPELTSRFERKTTIDISQWNLRMVEDGYEEYDGTETVSVDTSDIARRHGLLLAKTFPDGLRETYIKHLVHTKAMSIARAKRCVVALCHPTLDARFELEEVAKERFSQLLKAHSASIPMLASSTRTAEYSRLLNKALTPTLQMMGEAPFTIQENISEILLEKASNFVRDQDDYTPARSRVMANKTYHFGQHIYTSEDIDGGKYLSKLNEWERAVRKFEISDPSFAGWYRNPPQGPRSVTIKYIDVEGKWAGMHPDFILFHEVDGEIKPSIADPHGKQFDDFVPKMRGWHDYATEHNAEFHHLRPSIKIDEEYLYLELTDKSVRDALGNELSKPQPKLLRFFRLYGEAYRQKMTNHIIRDRPIDESGKPRSIIPLSYDGIVSHSAASSKPGSEDANGTSAEMIVVSSAAAVTWRKIIADVVPVTDKAALEMLIDDLDGMAKRLTKGNRNADQEDIAPEVEELLILLEIEHNRGVVATMSELVWSRVETPSST